VTIIQSDCYEVNNERNLDNTSELLLSTNLRAGLTAKLGNWLESLIVLFAGSLYGILLAGPGAGLGFTMSDKVLALSILAAAASGRIFWLLFAIGASLSGIAWARRVIDLGFGHMQLTEYMELGMAVNVILHFITHSVSMSKQMKRLILFAFLPALAFALAASIGGWMNGNTEFARPLRACLVIVGLPYAFLNIRNSDRAQRVFFGIVYLAVMSYIIRYFPLFTGRTEGLGLFLLAAPVISILLLSKRAPIIRICVILVVLLFALMSLTLTIFLSVALIVALYFSYYARTRLIRRLVLSCLIVTILVMILMSMSILRDELIFGSGTTLMKLDPNWYQKGFLASSFDHIRYKLYDRLALWIPAINEIANSPFKLNAGGRYFLVYTLSTTGEKRPWQIHVHNVFIEVARQFSLPGSIFFNVLILAVFITLYRSLKQSAEHNTHLLAWSLFGLSFLPGFIFGFYPVAGEIGVYFWLACGVSYKLRLLTTGGKSHVN